MVCVLARGLGLTGWHIVLLLRVNQKLWAFHEMRAWIHLIVVVGAVVKLGLLWGLP